MIKYAELDAKFLIDIVPEYENEIVMEEPEKYGMRFMNTYMSRQIDIVWNDNNKLNISPIRDTM